MSDGRPVDGADLVTAAELDARLSSASPPVVLDVRWRLAGPPARTDYKAGHVPTAVFVDLDSDLAGPPGRGGRHPLPSVDEAAQTFRRLGVSLERDVVVYDAADSTSAARAWWLLSFLGHPSVAILDGGFAAWCAAGLPVEAGEVRPTPGTFQPRPGRLLLLDAEAAAQVAGEGILLDARAPERYRGEVEPVDPVAGHIPGAVSMPTSGNVDEAGRFLSPERLAARFTTAGVEPGVSVGAYCGSGVTAAHEVFALHRAGISAGLYVGSWSEWITDPNRPVASGGEP